MELPLVVLLCFVIIVGYNAQQTGKYNYACDEGEQYYTCRSCEPRCDSIYSSNCSQPCFGGCFCRSGLVRADDNTCVAPEDCYLPKCQENEELKECGSPCEVNCTNYNSGIFCTKPCYRGCFCKPEYVRNSKRQCVLPSTCNVAGNQQCGANEHYVNCVSFCNSCWALNSCVTPYCSPGCDCKPGYYRDYYRRCITENECYTSIYGLQNSCGENEEYTSCVNTCNDCVSRGSCSYSKYYCEPGCDCKIGFLRNDVGACIPEQNCYTQKCNENEIYLDCGPSCRSTCENFRDLVYNRCQRACVPGCQCEGNLVLGLDGKCTRPEFCPKEITTSCPLNEQYYVCIPTCRSTCETYNDSIENCDVSCTKGCYCKGGLVRRSDGECVRPSECPAVKSHCPPSEVFYQCLPTCRTTCQSLNTTTGNCSTACEPGCFCQPGFVRKENGTCVRPDDCSPPKPTCSAGEIFYDCLPCPTTCPAENAKRPCTKICTPGCACSRGLVKRCDGLCVKPEDCEIDCGDNAEFRLCGTPCPKTCSNLDSTVVCPDRCVVGCFCIDDFVFGPKGTCIPKGSCPTSPLPCDTPDDFGITGRRLEPGQTSTSNNTLIMPPAVTQTDASDATASTPKPDTTARPSATTPASTQTPTTARPIATTPANTDTPTPVRTSATTPESTDTPTPARPSTTAPTRPNVKTPTRSKATTNTRPKSTTPAGPNETQLTTEAISLSTETAQPNVNEATTETRETTAENETITTTTIVATVTDVGNATTANPTPAVS